MKKLLKRVLCIAALAAVCLSFASCQAIDEMREQQAFWKDEENEKVIVFRGHEYYLLPEDENFDADGHDYTYGYVTESDVPVLLSGNMGYRMICSDDGTFIQVLNGGSFYCIDDRYNEMIKLFENYKLDNFCYYDYIMNDNHSYSIVKKLVDGKVKEALTKTLEGEYEKDDKGLGLNSPDIYLCDESLLFMSGSSPYSLRIEKDTAYVLTAHETNYVSYRVPDEYYDVIVDFYNQNNQYPFGSGEIFYATDDIYDYEMSSDVFTEASY